MSAIASANALVVDVAVQLDQLDVLADALAQRGEQRRVGLGVVERLPLGVDHRDPAQRDEERDGTGRRRELARDPPAQLGALLPRRAHQRDRRVVHVEVAPLELRRHGVAAAEVDHVERAQRDDLRQPRAARRLEPVRPGRQHAADEVVAQLGRGDVEHAGQEAGVDERLHRPAAGARRVEHEHLVAALLEPLARACDARRRHAEHRRAQQRPLRAVRDRRSLHHAGHRGGRVGEDLRRDRVDPGHVGHRRHQADVGTADVVARVAGRDGGDHQLGHADRQRLHRGRRDRRVARPAGGQDPVEAALAVQPRRQRGGRVRHRAHRGAAVGQRAEVRAGLARDLLARDVGRAAARRPAGARVGHEHVDAGELQALAQVRVLLALGVERADQQDGRHQR